jgi:quinol monooxygenase YgiN
MPDEKEKLRQIGLTDLGRFSIGEETNTLYFDDHQVVDPRFDKPDSLLRQLLDRLHLTRRAPPRSTRMAATLDEREKLRQIGLTDLGRFSIGRESNALYFDDLELDALADEISKREIRKIVHEVIDPPFDNIHSRFDNIDSRFDNIDLLLTKILERLTSTYQKRSVMVVRAVELRAKPGKTNELCSTAVEKVIPILRKLQGFLDGIVLVSSSDPRQVYLLSFWHEREDAERYHREQFSQVTETIRDLCDCEPVLVETYDLNISAAQGIISKKAA